jgi:thymidylate kinase
MLLVESWQTKNLYPPSELHILEDGNLVEAQRLIINRSKENGVANTIFLDADIIIDKNFMLEMVSNSIDKNGSAFYARSIPILNRHLSLINKVCNLYDLSAENMFSKRKHLHGRAFLIRTDYWEIPKCFPPFVADDIYLSFVLLSKYGSSSIVQIKSAKVYFKQVSNFKDFYNAFRRRRLEIEKCLSFNPEFKLLDTDQINRKFLWDKLLNQPFIDILIWLVLILLRKVSEFLYRMQSCFLSSEDQWLATTTTKSMRTSEKPLLILLEGLDCSGKKTVARLLQKKIVENEVSCTVNIGALGTRTYKYIASFVSSRKCPNIIRSIVYSIDGYHDYLWHKRFNTEIVIQISSPMRNWAYALVNKKYWRIFMMHHLKNRIANYDIIWYLTATYEERLCRHRCQSEQHENADNIEKRFIGKQIFTEMEISLRKMLNEKGLEKEIDTSVYTPEEISDKMFEYLKSNYKSMFNSENSRSKVNECCN